MDHCDPECEAFIRGSGPYYRAADAYQRGGSFGRSGPGRVVVPLAKYVGAKAGGVGATIVAASPPSASADMKPKRKRKAGGKQKGGGGAKKKRTSTSHKKGGFLGLNLKGRKAIKIEKISKKGYEDVFGHA